VLAVSPLLLTAVRRYPLEALIVVGILSVSALAVVFYVWELVIIGWVMDFLMTIGVPKIEAVPDPLEYEEVGEIIVVALRNNIATVLDCQLVQRQLQQLIDEGHCDFVLDFLHAGKISRHFRGVMVHVTKAARREAAKLGKPYRPVALPQGELFRVFEDRNRAVEAMSRHDGHGWVVLCCVPVGVWAVSEAT
jgi:hypothetical protein